MLYGWIICGIICGCTKLFINAAIVAGSREFTLIIEHSLLLALLMHDEFSKTLKIAIFFIRKMKLNLREFRIGICAVCVDGMMFFFEESVVPSVLSGNSTLV